MVNWSKRIFGGSRHDALVEIQRERDHLEQLLARFSDERLAIDTMLTTLTARTDELRPLAKWLDEVTRKTTTLGARLAEIGTTLQMLDDRATALERSDQVGAMKDALALMRKGIQEFHTRHGEIVRLNDKLEVDRQELEEFARRINGVVARLPELQSQVDGILSKLAFTGEAAAKTAVNDR